ncbi:MAG TPA: Gfo/Idh/MocA family oxidoreductase [Verrucomicrobiae bacterium]|nr:Gfo/Idh/MocA family oxidoreductase [Verrucomicrobiae bacterium]
MKSQQRSSRRAFLKAAGFAVAAPMILRNSVFGAAGAPPSERITIGFIGTGKMAHDYHLSTLGGFKDVECVAVCDVDTHRRLDAKKVIEDRYSKDGRGSKGIADYSDFRELIARKDIDAVCIATPDHWHAIPIIEACKAGKDVYCEKPLTLTIREAQLCIEAVRKHKRVLQTGSQQRSGVFGQFPLACELIRNGRIGKVKRVHVGVGGPSHWCDLKEEPMEPGLDWNLWLGYAPMRPYSSVLSPRGVHNHFPAWRNYREYAGGGMTDIGAHHFDIAQWALGLDDTGPVEVIPPEDGKAETGARLVFANGVEITHGGPSGCTFEGSAGKLYVDRGKLTTEPESILKEPIAEKDIHLPRNKGHHRDWVDCIRSRQRPIAHVDAGARTATLCHLLNLAYWNRRKLRWDAATWKFVDDSEANTWLDRDRREPWTLAKV